MKVESEGDELKNPLAGITARVWQSEIDHYEPDESMRGMNSALERVITCEEAAIRGHLPRRMKE
jgi:hypothetical protein